jgi:hypothetical protein
VAVRDAELTAERGASAGAAEGSADDQPSAEIADSRRATALETGSGGRS